MFADGRYFTPDGKARFVAVHATRQQRASNGFALTLNTGRVRDHWHTMTRTGQSARLSQHYAEPFVEMHPIDAARHNIADADLVRVSTGLGAVLVRALISSRQQPGSIFVPMHWSDQFASRARIDVLAPAITDAVSGQPASKNIAARVERFVAAAYGFAVTRRKPKHLSAEYWAMARCRGGWRLELAFASNTVDWADLVASLAGVDDGAEVETSAYRDAEAGRQRYACYAGGKLVAALYLGPEPVAVARDWVIAQLGTERRSRRDRIAVVAGRPGGGALDRGTTVCSCFGVGVNEIAAAAARGCRTVAAIGEALQAGTNCGSCRAEISAIIEAREPEPAPTVERQLVASV
jgi:assimilatory nitrate reductase catalytic subunit